MRGRRVISLLLSLVMTLSLCSGVWAENEPTASDEGVTTSYGGRTVRFYTGMDGGYLKYNPNELQVDGDNIDYTVDNDTKMIPAFFVRKTVDVSSAHLFLAIDKNNEEMTAPTLSSSDSWLAVTHTTDTDDAGKFVYELSVTGDRGNGDTAFITLEGQAMPFAIVFEENNSGEGNETLTNFKEALANNEAGKDEKDDSKLTDAQKNAANNYVDEYLLNNTGHVKNGNDDTTGISVKNGENAYSDAEVAAIKAAVKAFREAEWQVRDALGNVQGVQIEGDWTGCFGRYLTELASRVGISLWRDNEIQGGVEATVGSYAVTLYTNGDYGVFSLDIAANVSVDDDSNYTISWDYEQIFLTVTCSDENRPILSANNSDFKVRDTDNWEDGDKKVYVYLVELKRLDQEHEVEFTIGSGEGAPKFTVKFVAPNPWYSNQFAGVSEALKDAPEDAKKYGADYLNNATGRLECQNSDKGGILVKGSYTDPEKDAIKSAVRAFRAFRDGQHDDTLNALGNMGEIDFDGNGWNSYFGHYLAELASRVGISLWGDYPCWNGVEMTLGNNKTISFYTECDYGIPAYDNSLGVEANATEKTYTIPYTQTYYCFAIPAGSGEVTSLTVKGATSTEVKDENNEVIGYNCRPFQDNDIEVQTRWDGWFGSDNDKTYLFSVQTSHDRLAYDLPLVITYSDQSTAEFNVKAVDPNPWKPNDTVIAKNATGVLRELYEREFKAPAYGTNLHLYFPQQLHGYDATKAADYAAGTAHWDYKWSYDTNTGIVTIEVNSDHEDCWKNCVGTDTVLLDGVYFGYWIGGSDESKPAPYGIHLNFEPEGETPDCDYAILTEDYEYSNGWKMAVVNQRSITSTVLTFKEGTVSYGEAVAMSNDKANNKQSASNAEYKYALQFNVVTDKTKAIKLDTEETQRVPKDRVSFSTVNGVETDKWKCEVPEDGKAFVLYSGDEDYTEATAVNKSYGSLTLTDMIGTLGFKAPSGYTTLNYVIDDYSGNYIDSSNNGVNPLSVTAGQEVSFPVFKARYNSIKLIWSDNTGKTLTESLLVEMGNATPWMGLLGDTTTPTKPADADEIMDTQTVTFLQENGITVTYDAELGYFSTSVDASKLKDLSALNYLAMLTPMEGAAFFRMYGFGGSESPFVHGEERKEQVEAWFDGEDPISLTGVDGNDITKLSLIQIDTLTVNGLTVYFSETQLFRGVVIQWLDENENVLGYSYVYGRNGDFVTSVPTETTPEVTAPVDKPTLEGFDTDPGFTCDRNPQTGGNGSKVFFQFSVKHADGINKYNKAVIYLPYEYFGITPAEGMRRAARGEKPVIYHYLDESCANEKEIIYGEYTPFGVKFETGSFSPFVVDCSTTSTTHRYHTTTVTKADSPETFDGGIALYGALAVTSLTGMAYVGKKRED